MLTEDQLWLLRDLYVANQLNLKTSVGDYYDRWPGPMSNWWAQMIESSPRIAGWRVCSSDYGGSWHSSQTFFTLPDLVRRGYVSAKPDSERGQIDGIPDEMSIGTHRYFVTETGVAILEEWEKKSNV